MTENSARMSLSKRPPKGNSRPPISQAKRHSLQSAESITKFGKLARFSSQPRLRKDDIGGSLTSLRLEGSKKSSSLAQLGPLKKSGKTLSASNLAAVSDTNLSIKAAVPPRSYDKPNTSFSTRKQEFESTVQRYYYQLTCGCGNESCRNKFCYSSRDGKKFSEDIAGIVSIELASSNKRYFCTNEKNMLALPANVFEGEPDKPRPFLHWFFSTSPFKTLFQLPCKIKRDSETGLNASSAIDVQSKVTSKSLSNMNNKSMVTQQALDMQPATASHNGLSQIDSSQVEQNTLIDSWENLSAQECKTTSITKTSNNQAEGYNLDLEFSKSNLSGNLVAESELVVADLFGSDSSLNDVIDIEMFEKECALEMSSGYIQEFSLTHLTLPMLKSSIENYKDCRDSAFLVNTIRTVFSMPEALNDSFRKDIHYETSEIWERLDVASVQKSYAILLSLEPREIFTLPLHNAMEIHVSSLESTVIHQDEVNQLVILMENPLLPDSPALLRKLAKVLDNLSSEAHCALVCIFAQYDCHSFTRLLKVFQKFLGSHVHPRQCSEQHLIEICSVLSLFYDASREACSQKGQEIVPLSEFYSEELSHKLDFKKEYENWKVNPASDLKRSTKKSLDGKTKKISVLDFPFLLDPSSKVRVMHIDAVWQMRAEYQNAIVHQALVHQAQKVFEESEKKNSIGDSVKSAMCPFLVLEIRRDHLIGDTLAQISIKEGDLKKPLKIKYVGGGEQGLDMGGLQKEFFHMIVDCVFDEGYGMFTYLSESRSMWINGASLESEKEFELVGILLGLAIYNGVILDVQFPPVIYKKLQGGDPNLQDLMSVQPSLARSLEELLKFTGDVENTFCYTFQVSQSIFGDVQNVELIPNGAEIPVTEDNRAQFVEQYVRYLLVSSVAKQFDAFSAGFHKVCGGSALTLFRPDELELLICGCPVLDFRELEHAATYDDGYSAKHPTIRMLWHVVNEMTLEHKKALLSFVTGSDRVPLKGLAKLTFIVQQHGRESLDRLPTALTCFNRLLLPPYETREILKERLIVAIENGKGFGLT